MTSFVAALSPVRLIGLARVFSAVIFLIFATTDPVGTWFQAEIDDFAAIGYLAYALLALALIWNSWLREFRLQNFFIAADIVMMLFLPIGVEPTYLSFLVVTPVFLSICILELCLYWGVQVAIRISVLLNAAIALTSALVFAAPPSPGVLARQTLVLTFVTCIVLWLTRRGGLSSVPRLRFGAGHEGAALFDEIAAFAMTEARAAGVAVTWEDSEEGAVYHGAGILARNGRSLDPVSPKIPAFQRSPMIFDVRLGKGLTFDDAGMAKEVGLNDTERRVLAEVGIEQGAIVEIPSDLLPGWIAFANIEGLNCNDLLRIELISDEVSHSIDRFEVSVTAQRLAQHRLRETIARDLHDGVAQSLAGARFLLMALQRKHEVAKLPVDDIVPITRALDIEHRHVRELIDRLRAKEMEFDEHNLARAIADMAARQAIHWQVAIEVGETPTPIRVSGELSFEIRQICREAIANAVRHGEAHNISIGIQASLRSLRITVEDDGKGFSGPQPLAMPRTIGERVDALKGLSMVRSQPGATLVQFTIPLER